MIKITVALKFSITIMSKTVIGPKSKTYRIQPKIHVIEYKPKTLKMSLFLKTSLFAHFSQSNIR